MLLGGKVFDYHEEYDKYSSDHGDLGEFALTSRIKILLRYDSISDDTLIRRVSLRRLLFPAFISGIS